MIRRLLIAMTAALILTGFVGARLGLAQQQPPRPTPSDPGDDPPALPSGGEAPRDAPAGDDPPPLGQGDAPSTPKATPKGRAPARPAAPAPAEPRGEAIPAPADAPKTDDVIPAQAPAGDGNPLGPAKEPASGASPSGPAPDPLILTPDRIQMGPNTGSLTVEVQGPPNANLNREVKFKILVKNSGSAPVMGVTVRDPLPEGLEYVRSEPSCQNIGNILSWHLESLAAGSERVLTVVAIPRKTGDFDHAPTVSLRIGSKSRTMVKHPKLKVEVLQAEHGNVLKGRPVGFQVRVTNNGTGPARGVVLHADLTSGLKHDEGSSLVVVFKDYLGRDSLGAGESEAIDLDVDAAAGGMQECKVWAESPDVEDTPEAHALAKVTVVEPKLEVKLNGSRQRYTDTVASYTLTVTNPGSAPAKNVVAAAFLPNLGGRLVGDYTPSDVRWSTKERKLWWGVGDLEPGATKEMKFNVQLGGPGVFKVDAAAKADTCAVKNDSISTNVTGVPDVKCEVVARTKVLDVGEETIYEVRLSNAGTKEATDVLVKAELSDNLNIEDTTGTKTGATTNSPADGQRHDAAFPVLTIPPRGAQTLTLRVKATKVGVATCTVTVTHDESITKYSSTTKVMESR